MVDHWLWCPAAAADAVAALRCFERPNSAAMWALFLEPKIESARHDHSRSQVHKLTTRYEVYKWKWTVFDVCVGGRVLVCHVNRGTLTKKQTQQHGGQARECLGVISLFAVVASRHF